MLLASQGELPAIAADSNSPGEGGPAEAGAAGRARAVQRTWPPGQRWRSPKEGLAPPAQNPGCRHLQQSALDAEWIRETFKEPWQRTGAGIYHISMIALSLFHVGTWAIREHNPVPVQKPATTETCSTN